MVRLVADDDPDVVALQEVPLWAVSLLEGWSGMRAFAARTKRALFGPLARRLQELDPNRIRSPLTGQASAILVGARLRPGTSRAAVLRAWRPGAEGRVLQLLAVEAEGQALLVANVHASVREEDARADLARIEELVAGEGACLVCGDFNVPGAGLAAFSPPLPGLDQILVRGLRFERPPAPWEPDRRRADGALLSDHAPIEAVIA